jgi:hypothetical protein
LNCRTAWKQKKEESEPEEKPLPKKADPASIALHSRWFNLTAGINGILPASGGPLPFIPLFALNQLRCALKEWLTLAFDHLRRKRRRKINTKAKEVSYCQMAAKMDQK